MTILCPIFSWIGEELGWNQEFGFGALGILGFATRSNGFLFFLGSTTSIGSLFPPLDVSSGVVV